MNTSVFQYYVKMTGYDDVLRTGSNGESKDDAMQMLTDAISKPENQAKDSGTKSEPPTDAPKQASSGLALREFTSAV